MWLVISSTIVKIFGDSLTLCNYACYFFRASSLLFLLLFDLTGVNSFFCIWHGIIWHDRIWYGMMGSCMLYCVCFYTIVIWLRGMVTCHVILYQVVPSLIALCFITAFYLTLPCLMLHTIFNHSISYHVSWGTVPCYSKFTLQFYIVPRGTNLQ